MRKMFFALMFLVFVSSGFPADKNKILSEKLRKAYGSAEVTGYPDYGYSLRKPQRILLDNMVSVINAKSSELKQIAGEGSEVEVVFTVIGGASQTGTVLENDDTSSKRANTVEQYLKGKFQKIKFSTYPQGSELDGKKVIVSWKLDLITKTNVPDISGQFSVMSKRLILIISICAGCIIIAGLAIFLTITLKTKKLPEPVPVPKDTVVIGQQEETEILPAIRDGIRYGVKVKVREDGSRLLPFPDPKDPTRLMTKSNRDDAKKEIIQCIRNPQNADIVKEFLKDETIVIIGTVK